MGRAPRAEHHGGSPWCKVQRPDASGPDLQQLALVVYNTVRRPNGEYKNPTAALASRLLGQEAVDLDLASLRNRINGRPAFQLLDSIGMLELFHGVLRYEADAPGAYSESLDLLVQDALRDIVPKGPLQAVLDGRELLQTFNPGSSASLT